MMEQVDAQIFAPTSEDPSEDGESSSCKLLRKCSEDKDVESRMHQDSVTGNGAVFAAIVAAVELRLWRRTD
jgi:hypothetical protein